MLSKFFFPPMQVTLLFFIQGFFLYVYSHESTQPSTEHAKAEKKEEKTQTQNLEKDKVTPPLFRLPDIRIAVIKKGAPVAYIQMTVDLKARPDADMNVVEILTTRYRSICYTHFMTLLSSQWIQGTNVTADQILPHLKTLYLQIFGDHLIESVKIEKFYFHIPKPKDQESPKD